MFRQIMSRLLPVVLCLSLIAIGCTREQSLAEPPAEPSHNGAGDAQSTATPKKSPQVTYNIWGITPDLMYLVPLTVEADRPQDRPNQAVQALTDWPDQSGATLSPWPEGTRLELVGPVKNGKAVVNITNLKSGVFGSSGEGFALNSLVLTLTQFAEPKIDRVQILVDGQTKDSLAGHVDISRPLESGSYLNWISWDGDPVLDPAEAIALTLYFAEPTATYLVPITRFVPKTKEVARAVVDELISGPKEESGLDPVIPAGTRCLGLSLADGTLTVDFSRELRDNHSGGSAAERLTVDAVVHSLGQLPGVKQVQILIEGEKGASIGGHRVLSEPIAPDYLNPVASF